MFFTIPCPEAFDCPPIRKTSIVFCASIKIGKIDVTAMTMNRFINTVWGSN